MVTYIYISIWVNIGSGSGLVLGGTKPLPEPMLTIHQSHDQWGLAAFTWGQFHRRYLSLIWKNSNLRLLPHLPWTNELTNDHINNNIIHKDGLVPDSQVIDGTKSLLHPKSIHHCDGLVQERHNSSALAMELRLSSINPLIDEIPMNACECFFCDNTLANNDKNIFENLI